MSTATAQRIQISDHPDRLYIAVPILTLPLRIILHAGYAAIVGATLISEHLGPGVYIFISVTAYFVLVFGWDSSCLTATPERIISRIGPIPIPLGRRTLDTADVVSFESVLVRAATGRGTYERYAVQAFTRYGQKPVIILEGFEREEDAVSVARTLTSRLLRRTD